VLGNLKKETKQVEENLPKLSDSFRILRRSFKALSDNAVDSMLGVNLNEAKKRMLNFRECAIMATNPHNVDQRLDTDEEWNPLCPSVEEAVAPVVGAGLGVAGDAAGKALIGSASDVCVGLPDDCVNLGVGFLAVAGVAASMMYVAPDTPLGFYKAQRDNTKIQKIDFDLNAEENDLKSIIGDLKDAGKITDMMIASSEDSKQTMAKTVQSAVSAIHFEVKDSIDIMDKIVKLAIDLKYQDDINYKTWKDCEDGWFNFCIAGAMPRRILPQNVEDGVFTLKDAIVRWAADLNAVTNCVKDVREICDKSLIAKKMGVAKQEFSSVFGDWQIFKEALCEYHSWKVCDNYSVLVNMDAKINEPIEVDVKLSTNLISTLFGCSFIMAFGVFVWWLLSRKHIAMRQPLLM